jgi:glutathione S-transferase
MSRFINRALHSGLDSPFATSIPVSRPALQSKYHLSKHKGPTYNPTRMSSQDGHASKAELDANQGGDPNKKTYHKQPTGRALKTAQAHSKEHDLKLYGSCFCPFVHRVWISLEHKGLDYEYVEVDVYRKPKLLLDINPRGLVPALRHGDWGCYESTVLMEYLEDLDEGKPLLPKDPKQRAHSRLWVDHINRHIVPLFYRYLQAQEIEDQAKYAKELTDQIAKLVHAADTEGPLFLPGNQLSFVDVQIAPWVVRLEKVLKPYRGWPDPEPSSRWERWIRAIENDEAVKKTTSEDQLYLDSYERYAENRPNTSQVREAINSGRGLP